MRHQGLVTARSRARPGTAKERDQLPPSHHWEFPASPVGECSIGFGLETNIFAGGRAGSNRAVLILGMVIVMSGHGHRRMREVFFGGCTQSVLEASDLSFPKIISARIYDVGRIRLV